MTKKPPDEQPAFDYSRVGTEWRESFEEILTSTAEAQSFLQRPIPKSVSDPDHENYDEDKSQAFFDRRDAAIALVKSAPKTQKDLMAQVLVDVPRAWLLENAPDNIDWSNSVNFKFISYDGYGKLLTVWLQGGGARPNAKN